MAGEWKSSKGDDHEVEVSQDPSRHLVTQIAEEAIAAIDKHENARVLVMVAIEDGGEDGHAYGVGIHGYDGPEDVIVDGLLHMRAICQANGREMAVTAVQDPKSN